MDSSVFAVTGAPISVTAFTNMVLGGADLLARLTAYGFGSLDIPSMHDIVRGLYKRGRAGEPLSLKVFTKGGRTSAALVPYDVSGGVRGTAADAVCAVARVCGYDASIYAGVSGFALGCKAAENAYLFRPFWRDAVLSRIAGSRPAAFSVGERGDAMLVSHGIPSLTSRVLEGLYSIVIAPPYESDYAVSAVATLISGGSMAVHGIAPYGPDTYRTIAALIVCEALSYSMHSGSPIADVSGFSLMDSDTVSNLKGGLYESNSIALNKISTP